jgi:hypothetical protein
MLLMGMDISTVTGTAQKGAGYGLFSRSSAPTSDANVDFDRSLDETETDSPSEASSHKGKLMSRFMDGASLDGVITGAEMAAFRDKYELISRDILQSTMAELGISSRCKVSISRDPYGDIQVSGNLSAEDTAALQSSLNDNDDFQNAYAAGSSTACLIEQGNKNVEFSKAYAENEQAALARYGWLFSAKWDCKLTYEDGIAGFDVSVLP